MRVAEDILNSGITVDGHGEFSSAIERIIRTYKPKKLIETGTYNGVGTTLAILYGLAGAHGKNGSWKFITMEIDPERCSTAGKNLGARCIGPDKVEIRNQLSISVDMLPNKETIQAKTIDAGLDDSIAVDHQEHVRVERYFEECHKKCQSDCGLQKAIEEFDNCPDFVLLDSSGCIGDIEFYEVIDSVKSPCIIALDDIFHVKHHISFRVISGDNRFRILASGREKFGWCIAEYIPK
jgi:hypothetical protein